MKYDTKKTTFFNQKIIAKFQQKHTMKRPYLIYFLVTLLLYSCNEPKDRKSNASKATSGDTSQVDSTTPEIQEARETSNELEAAEQDSILRMISLFKAKNIEAISEKISYPLEREYPIPSIKDKAEFKQRFEEVFDAYLVAKIAHSKIEDWSEVGWRGIMLDNGEVWMGNADGTITSVNYQSNFEKQRKELLIAEDKDKIHPSLKTFKLPTYKIKTEKFLIRIDELTTGKYRYASWKISDNESTKPEIVLQNGTIEFEGSGGNHLITFVNGKFTYKVYRIILGEGDSPEIRLIVEKEGRTILTQDGTLILE
jgi:hypothetical protein